MENKENKKKFIIHQVTDQSTKPEEVIKVNKTENAKPVIDRSERFVSTMYGSKVKDVDYYPTADFNNGGRQYDFMRDGNKITEKDTRDYCVPKQEEFYGYAPIEDKSSDEEIQTFDTPSQAKPTPSSFAPQVSYDQYIKQEEIIEDKAEEEEQIVYEQVSERYSYDNNFEEQNEQVKPQEEPERTESVLEQAESNEQTESSENTEYEASNQYDEISSDFYSGKNDDTIDDLADNDFDDEDSLDDFDNSDDDDEEEPEWNPLPTQKAAPSEHKKTEKYTSLKNEKKSNYRFPSINLLRRKNPNVQSSFEGAEKQKEIINMTLEEFDIGGHVVSYQKGPTVTLFEVQLDQGVKYNKITTIKENLQGNLEAIAIRVYAPIPGKRTAGIEVPNIDREMVYFGDLVARPEFMNDKNPLKVIFGIDVTGTAQYVSISEMPHALIAGCTRSGKSVCINTILMSLIYRAHPDDVKIILIDPKKVEFTKYQGLPHLATPVITDPKLAIATMRWLVDEMEDRYDFFSSIGVTNYQEYLEMQGNSIDTKHIPYLVLVIDEFADLMQTGGSDVESIVARLTAKARAAGIHLIVATQRPSVDVISGTIKSNLPTRIAFKVQKALDSTIILDKTGAEKLLGNGDMLYYNEMGKECRIQGAFISTAEIKEVVNSIRTGDVKYVFTPDDLQQKAENESEDDIMNDPMFAPIARHIVQTQNASINRIQTRFKCGFNRVQSIVEKLCELGVVSENLGSKARTVLMEPADLEDILSRK